MDDRVDPVRGGDAVDQRAVGDVALMEGDAFGHRPAEAGRQIVDHHRRLPAVEKLEHHVAADVAGAARDENCHVVSTPAVRARRTHTFYRLMTHPALMVPCPS